MPNTNKLHWEKENRDQNDLMHTFCPGLQFVTITSSQIFLKDEIYIYFFYEKIRVIMQINLYVKQFILELKPDIYSWFFLIQGLKK